MQKCSCRGSKQAINGVVSPGNKLVAVTPVGDQVLKDGVFPLNLDHFQRTAAPHRAGAHTLHAFGDREPAKSAAAEGPTFQHLQSHRQDHLLQMGGVLKGPWIDPLDTRRNGKDPFFHIAGICIKDGSGAVVYRFRQPLAQVKRSAGHLADAVRQNDLVQITA